MTNLSKITDLIASFSNKETKSFMKYVDIEYSNSIFRRFFHFLAKDTKNTTEFSIFSHLYPEDRFNDQRMKKLISRAKIILQNYISMRYSETIDKDLKAVQYLEAKKIVVWKSDIIQKIKKDSTPFLHPVYFEVEWDEAQELSSKITSLGVRTAEPKLQEAHQALDDHYLIQKLKLSCSALNFSNINEYTYDLGIIEYIEGFMGKSITEYKPLLYLYYHTYLMVRDKEEDQFDIIFLHLKSNPIPKGEDYFELFTMLINFCIQKVNQGQRTYLRTLFELYQIQIRSENIYDNQGLMDVNGYKNIAALALNLKEYNWVEEFIFNQKEKLPKAHREEHFQFVNARFLFETKKYDECIRWIMLSRPQDLLNNLSMRVLLCKAHFENNEWDLVASSIQNAKVFLMRHRNKAYQIRIFQNFFKVLEKVISSKQTKADVKNLIKLLSVTNPLAEKSWLMEKMNKLL